MARTWKISVPISSAVSMPSREIMSSVKRKTPIHALRPAFWVDFCS